MKFTVESAAYHRNGVSGEGFYVGTAWCEVDGYDSPLHLLVTFFPHEHLGEPLPAGKRVVNGRREFANVRLAVMSLDPSVNVEERWRGDHFYEVADAIVAEATARI